MTPEERAKLLSHLLEQEEDFYLPESLLWIIEDQIKYARNEALEEAADIAESWSDYNVAVSSIGPRIARAIREKIKKCPVHSLPVKVVVS